MHPRLAALPKRVSNSWIHGAPRDGCGAAEKAELVLEFVRERGSVHPREVDDHFSRGK